MRAFLEEHLASAGACIRDAWQGPTCERGQVLLRVLSSHADALLADAIAKGVVLQAPQALRDST
eukprot:6380473-Amphidinium_carterae.1